MAVERSLLREDNGVNKKNNMPIMQAHSYFWQHFSGAVVVLALALPVAANNDNDEPSMFSLHGFGSLGTVHSSMHDADFIGTFFQPDGVGYSHSWAASVDSKIGAQLDIQFNDRLSAVVQAVSQYNQDGSYRPQIEWANLAYQVTPDFNVRLGRTVAHTFLLSNVRAVGYANTWIRPPIELYDLMPVTNKDGVDASYKLHFGSAVDTLQVSWGETVRDLPGGGEVDAKQFLNIRNIWEQGPATIHLGYMSTTVDFRSQPIDQLLNGFVQFGNSVPGPAGIQALEISRRRSTKATPYSIATIGASYDNGKWLMMTEWAKSNPGSFASDHRSGYLTGAYRLGNATAYVTIADLKAVTIPEPLAIPTADLPPPVAGLADALNNGLAAIVNAFRWEQRTMSLGVRWDVWTNAALKFQYDRVRTDSGSSGWLVNAQPGFRSGEAVDVFSLTLDFVF